MKTVIDDVFGPWKYVHCLIQTVHATVDDVVYGWQYCQELKNIILEEMKSIIRFIDKNYSCLRFFSPHRWGKRTTVEDH